MSDLIRECRILTRNFIDSDSTITPSKGGDVLNLYDRDNDSLYLTVGAKRDTITADIEIIFKEGSTETEVTFNNFIMLNTNVKNFTFYKYQSGVYVEAFTHTVPVGRKYISVAFGNITTSRIKVSLHSTQYKFNQEKEVGEMIVSRLRYVLSQNPVSYNRQDRETKSIITLADGSEHVAFTRFSDNRVSKYGASVGFSLMPQEDYDFLEILKNEGQPFLWWPEHDVRPQQIYFVNWVNAFTANYTTTFKGAGYDLTMELREV